MRVAGRIACPEALARLAYEALALRADDHKLQEGIAFVQRYDAKQFLRDVPTALLQQYLSEVDIAGHVDWTAPVSVILNQVFEAVEAAPEALHRQIHNAFRMIHRLAIEEGIAMIRDEIRRRQLGEETFTALEQYRTPTGQAFWTFLHLPEVFSFAYHFGIADMVQRWHRICIRTSKPLASEDESSRRLADDLCAYYQEFQGRGHGCDVTVFQRDSRRYWFAYVQDYAKELMVYDEQHQLHAEVLELAFDIIFVYDHQAGTLAISTDGDLEHVKELQCLFGRAVLNEEIPNNSAKEHYHLQRFLDRTISLPLLPTDRVASVDVYSMQLQFLGQRQGGISVIAGRDASWQRVYDNLEKALLGFKLPRDLITVSQVELYVTFRPDGGMQPKSRIVRLTPHHCGCLFGPWDDEFRELLRRWGLYDSSSCDTSLTDD
jgi:hypothetical protein